MNEEAREAVRNRNREKMEARRNHMNEEAREAVRNRNRERIEARRNNMNEEERQLYLENMRNLRIICGFH